MPWFRPVKSCIGQGTQPQRRANNGSTPYRPNRSIWYCQSEGTAKNIFKLMRVVGLVLQNRRFDVELQGKKIDGEKKKADYPKETYWFQVCLSFTPKTTQSLNMLDISYTWTTLQFPYRMEFLNHRSQNERPTSATLLNQT